MVSRLEFRGRDAGPPKFLFVVVLRASEPHPAIDACWMVSCHPFRGETAGSAVEQSIGMQFPLWGPLGPARTSCRTIEPPQTLSFTSAGKFPGPIRFEIGDEPRRVVCAPSATRCRRGPTSRNPRHQPGREREPTMNRNRRRARLRAYRAIPFASFSIRPTFASNESWPWSRRAPRRLRILMTGDAPAALPGVAHPSNIPGRAPLE